jgi:hypothetical protein
MEFLNKDYKRRWIARGGLVAWLLQSPNLNPLDFFLWGCMKLRVYCSGKPKARHQLVEAIDEATVHIRNELGCTQWQHSMARLAACMQSNGKHFKHVAITLKLNCCKSLK